MQAAILVGGRGTRLGEFTNSTIKPLLEINGKPFLELLIQFLKDQGVNDVLLLAGYKSEQIIEFSKRYTNTSIRVSCISENSPLGTGGAIINACSQLEKEFILLNGDTIFKINLRNLTQSLPPRINARIALREVNDVSRYGSINIEGNLVKEMKEKSDKNKGLVNGGIYFFKKAYFEKLPLEFISLELDILPKLIASKSVEGIIYPDYFIDIGTPADLKLGMIEIPNVL